MAREPGGLQSTGLQRVSTTERLHGNCCVSWVCGKVHHQSHTRVPSPFRFFPHVASTEYRLQFPVQTVGSYWLPSLYTVVCVCLF